MMNNLGDLYKTASAAFGLLPGIAILVTNLGVPPDTSQLLFAGTIEAVGVLTLLTLWTNRDKIGSISAQNITVYVLISAGVFLISLFLYLFLYGQYVVQVPYSNSLLFPLWPQGELKEGLISYGSKFGLIQHWGADDVYKVIQSSSPAAVQLTSLVFLFNYLVVFVSITFAFGILGIKNSGPMDE
jgi:hypothetical protein